MCIQSTPWLFASRDQQNNQQTWEDMIRTVSSVDRVSTTPGNPGYLLEFY